MRRHSRSGSAHDPVTEEARLIELPGVSAPLRGICLSARDGLGDTAPLFDSFVVGAIPAFGDWRKAPFLADRLETKPAIGEFGRNRGASDSLRFFRGATLLTAPSVACVAAVFVLDPALNKATLGGRWMHLPHVPHSSLFVFEASMSHGRAMVSASSQRCEILANLDRG